MLSASSWKWFAYAGSLVVASFMVAPVLPLPMPWPACSTGVRQLFLPVAMGIAVLRYRLYDLDRLINRTLVYGLLTTILGLGYAGCRVNPWGGVRWSSWQSAELGGGRRHPRHGGVVPAGSSPHPAGRGPAVQPGRKYNMAQTVEAFAARLRDELDLDALSAELLAVVDQTMQPTTVSLWLRPWGHEPYRDHRRRRREGHGKGATP